MSSTNNVPRPYARLGANHGYVIDGDVAQLHADVELLNNPPLAGNWALQLWACDAPHAGGPLSGVKIAEADLRGYVEARELASWRLDAQADAHVPGGQRDYAMVLVLASGEGTQINQVHDFANYPERQRFVTPHLDGGARYQIDGEEAVLEADAIRSPRDADNVSGSLSLELWALSGEYRGGTFEGHLLGRADLGRLPGQSSRHAISERVTFSAPPPGEWNVVLMLREWTGSSGYVTRDYARFDVRHVVAPPSPTPDVIVAEPAPRTDEDAQPGRVAINSATAAELAVLKGLSRKVAAEIVKKRPYASLDALTKVKGIGPKLLEKLRPSLTID